MTTLPSDKILTRVISNLGIELLVHHDVYGHFHAQPMKKHGLVVCGDQVVCAAPKTPPDHAAKAGNPHPETLRVLELAPRTGLLQRTDRRGNAKPIAANLTQLIAVTAPKPPFDPLLIDRYTIAARHMGVHLQLVMNKTDLLDTLELQAQANDIESLYRSIGYSVTRCNSKNGEGIDDLSALMAGEVSILVGQSGVGKSSILNALVPERSAKTGALSDNSGLGKHTTTVTTWYDLPHGGAIVDSAGVRQFALEHLSGVDIESGFVEIAEASTHCRFRDCKHIKEPECAVLAGVNQGNISTQRYDHFQIISSQVNCSGSADL